MATSFDITNAEKPTIIKDPNAELDYSEDWTAWLLAASDTISSFVTIIPAESTMIELRKSHNGLIPTAWFSGGRVGQTEKVTYRITTVAGRIDDRTIYFKIKER